MGRLSTACALAVLLFAPMARAEPLVLPLAVHVATEAGREVVDDAFVGAQVARANAILRPHGVGFVVTERRTLAAGHAHVDDRDDRHALGAFARPGAINCFFVASLRDVDEPERVRRGVHWRSVPHAPAHYVIVSSISFPDVLAHELGHFLGNPRHSATPGNLMSYERTEALPTLDAEQVERMRRRLRRYLREGELVPLPDARTDARSITPTAPARGPSGGSACARALRSAPPRLSRDSSGSRC